MNRLFKYLFITVTSPLLAATAKPLPEICKTDAWEKLPDQKDKTCVERKDHSLRVCKQGGQGGIAIEREGKVISSWSAPAFMGSSSGIDVVEVSDDTHVFIASFISIGNGMTPPHWRVWAVDPKDIPKSEPKNHVDIDDYGRGSFAKNLSDDHCSLWATHWVSIKDEKRGWGRYLSAYPLTLKNSGWQNSESDFLTRRLLNSFTNMKNKTAAKEADMPHDAPYPLSWLHENSQWRKKQEGEP